MRHPLVAYFEWAEKHELCSNPVCTTCGNGEFRHGLSLVSAGLHPDDPTWDDVFETKKRERMARWALYRGARYGALHGTLLRRIKDAPWEVVLSAAPQNGIGYVQIIQTIFKDEKTLLDGIFEQIEAVVGGPV